MLWEGNFSVNGTLLVAWVWVKSFRPKWKDTPTGDHGRDSEVDSYSECRSNENYWSMAEPEAKTTKKGRGSERCLCFRSHVWWTAGRPAGESAWGSFLTSI